MKSGGQLLKYCSVLIVKGMSLWFRKEKIINESFAIVTLQLK